MLLQGCLTKMISFTHYILQKAVVNYQISLSPIASLILGGAFKAQIKGMISKIFLGAKPQDTSIPLHA